MRPASRKSQFLVLTLLCLAAALLIFLPALATDGDYGVNANPDDLQSPGDDLVSTPQDVTSEPTAQPTSPPPTATPVPPTATPVPPTIAPTATTQQRPTATNCPSGMVWDPREEACVPVDQQNRGD